jgi:hypothetical protein
VSSHRSTESTTASITTEANSVATMVTRVNRMSWSPPPAGVVPPGTSVGSAVCDVGSVS